MRCISHFEYGSVYDLDILLQEALQVSIADPAIVDVIDHHPQVRLIVRDCFDDLLGLTDYSVAGCYESSLADFGVGHLVVEHKITLELLDYFLLVVILRHVSRTR